MINCDCPHCNYSYQVDDSYAGKAVKCPSCSQRMEVPPPSVPSGPGDKKNDPFNFANQGEGFAQRRAREMQEGDGGGDGGHNQMVGWLIFLLIFGVGNIILYSTTGWLIIPIRR